MKCPTYKYLGFGLDATLNYKSHIADVTKKVMHKMSMLSKSSTFTVRVNDLALV